MWPFLNIEIDNLQSTCSFIVSSKMSSLTLVKSFFGIWLFLFIIPWTEYNHVTSFTKIIPLRISDAIIVLMLNLKDKLHYLGHLVVIRINHEGRKHSAFQILRHAPQFNESRWWDAEVQLKRKKQSTFIGTSFSILSLLSSCHYPNHSFHIGQGICQESWQVQT